MVKITLISVVCIILIIFFTIESVFLIVTFSKYMYIYEYECVFNGHWFFSVENA